MENPDGLPYGPLTESCAHLCIDMQNLFYEKTDWHAPWMRRVLPVVERLARARPERTIFTRFLPPASAREMPGTWRRYYERWESITRERLPPRMVELVPSLAELVPPARVIDKMTYSPFTRPELDALLKERGIDTLIISGTETDVCIAAAVLDAVDRGYRVVVPRDALCSSSDATHDALLTLYQQRFGQQIEVATAERIIQAWR